MLAAIDAQAARLGQNRSKYILSLVEEDLNAKKPQRKRFASNDLIGSMRTGLPSGDNATVRRVIRQRLHEKNR